MTIIMELDNGMKYYEKDGRYYENGKEIQKEKYHQARRVYYSEIKNEDDKIKIVYRR